MSSLCRCRRRRRCRRGGAAVAVVDGAGGPVVIIACPLMTVRLPFGLDAVCRFQTRLIELATGIGQFDRSCVFVRHGLMAVLVRHLQAPSVSCIHGHTMFNVFCSFKAKVYVIVSHKFDPHKSSLATKKKMKEKNTQPLLQCFFCSFSTSDKNGIYLFLLSKKFNFDLCYIHCFTVSSTFDFSYSCRLRCELFLNTETDLQTLNNIARAGPKSSVLIGRWSGRVHA
jgi:hypothetical protein